MKSDTIISLSAVSFCFFLVFASFGFALGITKSPWFLIAVPIGTFFAWAECIIFDDWSRWHSLCYVLKDRIAENHYWSDLVKRLENR